MSAVPSLFSETADIVDDTVLLAMRRASRIKVSAIHAKKPKASIMITKTITKIGTTMAT